MSSCACARFRNNGTCSHVERSSPRRYVPLSERIPAAVERAAAAYRAARANEGSRDLTSDERRRKAQEMRQQAAELERGL